MMDEAIVPCDMVSICKVSAQGSSAKGNCSYPFRLFMCACGCLGFLSMGRGGGRDVAIKSTVYSYII